MAPSFAWPARGAVIRPFNPPQGPYGAGGHAGIDIALARGSEVRASADGTVSFAGSTPVGTCVSVIHRGGFKTTYVSLASPAVRSGQEVQAGQALGTSDGAKDHSCSVPHLHFGIYLNGVALDPLPLLQGRVLDPSESLFLGPWEDQKALDTFFAHRSGGGFFDWLGRGFGAAGKVIGKAFHWAVDTAGKALGAVWRWTCRAARAVGGAFAAFYRACIEPWLVPVCRGLAEAVRAALSNRYVQAVLAGLAAAALVCLAVVGAALLFGLSVFATVVACVVGSLAAIGYAIYYAFAAGDSFTFGGCFLASLSVGAIAAGACLLLSYLAPLIGTGWSSLGWLGLGKAFLVHGCADSLVYIGFCLATGRKVSPMGVLASFLIGGATGSIGKLVTSGLLSHGAAQALASGWFSAGGTLLTGRGVALSTLAWAAVTRFANKAAYVLFCGCAGFLGDVIMRGVTGAMPSIAESLLCFGGGCLTGILNLAGSGEGVAGIISRLSRGRITLQSDLLKALMSKSFSRGFKEGSTRLLRWLRGGEGGKRESLWRLDFGGEN
ncbi:MAG: M23 family metallopeptidase [Actinomycetota bacterium]